MQFSPSKHGLTHPFLGGKEVVGVAVVPGFQLCDHPAAVLGSRVHWTLAMPKDFRL
jgi:hypothetical protein